MNRRIPFVKMTGAGNDFIVIDAIKRMDYAVLARRVCDRTGGIGADGLLVLETSRKSDYRMRIFNADGSEAEMCGNGARCMAAYIVGQKSPKKAFFGIETLAGVILAEAKGEEATVRLSDPKDYRPNLTLMLNTRKLRVHYIDTGVPHTVVFVNGLEAIDVATIGRMIRFHKKFAPRGTNVNFIEPVGDGLVAVRTYERGVEAETRACGTGSVASAVIAYLQSQPAAGFESGAKMRVRTRNGDILEVVFDITDHGLMNVWLKGPAKRIAQGEFFYTPEK